MNLRSFSLVCSLASLHCTGVLTGTGPDAGFTADIVGRDAARDATTPPGDAGPSMDTARDAGAGNDAADAGTEGPDAQVAQDAATDAATDAMSRCATRDPIAPSTARNLVDPSIDWTSLPRAASSGQIVVDGDIINQDTNSGRFFGLSMTPSGVHGRPMGDGATRRFGPVMDPDGSGRTVLEYAVNWVENAGYTYQSGPHNNSIDPRNDRLFYDGSRVQVSHLANRISVGDVTWQMFSVRMGEWVFANDNKVINQYHAPDSDRGIPNALNPYLAWYINRGELHISIAYDTSNQPNQRSSSYQRRVLHQEPLAASDVGQWQDWIVHMKQTPNAGESPFVRIWRRKPDGEWHQLVDYSGSVGFRYDGFGVSNADQNYLLESYYQWHVNNPTDTAHALRRTHWAWSILVRDNGGQYSLQDLQDHADIHGMNCR